MQTLLVAMDSIKPHQIALKSKVSWESPKALMSSIYLCAISRPDMSHIISEVFKTDVHWEMQCL
jgi:hypothetical protein